MPSRIVREGIVTSQRINSLSLGAEVLYRRLMSVADDFGRFHGAILTLRVSCFPTNPERFREKEFEKWFNELLRGENPLVKTYMIGGITYLEIQEFGQQIRGKSKFPDPPWFRIQQDTRKTATQPINVPPEDELATDVANAQGSRSRSRSRNRLTPLTPQGGNEENLSPIEALISLDPDAGSGKKRPQAIWFDGGFEDWYKSYWNHVGRKKARIAYEKAINRLVDRKERAGYNDAKLFLLREAQQARLRFEPTESWTWRKNINPATWLNGELWTDEQAEESLMPAVHAQSTAAERRRKETLAGLDLVSQIDGRKN